VLRRLSVSLSRSRAALSLSRLPSGARSLAARIALAVGFASTLAVPAMAASPDIVINQVYGGAGCTTAACSTYTRDYVELFNRSASAVSISGWSLQYGATGGTTWQSVALTGTVQPGQFILVGLGSGSGGVNAIPTPDISGGISISATVGKIALVNSTTVLSGACPSSGIVDLVGYGAGTNCSETAVSPSPSTSTAIFRAANGCTDSDNNASDFTAATPNPRNSATAAAPCGPALPALSINDVSASEGNAGTTAFTFTVSLSAPAGAGGVTFDIATADGTASSASDYAAQTLTSQTIAPGNTAYTFTVLVNGDTTSEPNETFFVNVTNVSGATLADGQGLGTIINDDGGAMLSINDVSLNEGNSGTTSFVFTVSLSEPAPVGGVTFDIATANGTATAGSDYVAKSLTAQTIAAGATTYSFTVDVNGDSTFEGNETFFVNVSNVTGAFIADGQGLGTIVNDDASTGPRIHDVQGSGSASTMVGQSVTLQGIVTANFQGANSLGGFYIQEEDANIDADPATSEGIFIFSSTPVAVGDKVNVTGTVAELGTAPNTLTELTTVTVQIVSSGNPLPALVDIAFPVAAISDLERYEGMRVRVPQTLTTSEHFRLARYGELLLSANGRLLQPTEVVDPNDNPASGNSSSGSSNVAAVSARANLNLRSSIVLADTSSTQNPTTIPFLDPLTNTIRLGTTVDNLTGILNHSFGTYVIHATEAPNFNYAPRPLTPPVVGGNLKVASFNVLNFFNGNGAGGGFPTSRGADTPYEFGRQKAKIVAAICGLGADVVGLLEMENDGNGATSALTELTTALTAENGCGNWTYVPNPSGWGTIPGSTDEIRPAIIYRTTAVSPVGASMSPNNSAFNQARAPVAQTFSVTAGASAGAKLSVIVNHFKSKGGTGTGADADQGDGQGNWNNARKGQATALLSFITAVQAAASDPDVIILGDLNAYSQEDPMDILRAGGLIDLAEGEHSYVFDGQSGSLDHAMVTPSLRAQVTNAHIWNINSDEPLILDYNVEFKNNPNCTSTTCTSPDFYQPTPFRSSDHDPVLVGFALGTPVLDIDDSAPVTAYDPATDGLLLVRYLFGLRGNALIANAISPSARRNAAQVEQHINDSLARFDVDGDGQTLALTDGLMILRRLLGITSAAAVTQSAKTTTRSDADIVLIIDTMKP